MEDKIEPTDLETFKSQVSSIVYNKTIPSCDKIEKLMELVEEEK